MVVGTLTALTMVAFAANSLLCRLALGASLADPVSFTTIRLVSGAVAFVAISRLSLQGWSPRMLATLNRARRSSWNLGYLLPPQPRVLNGRRQIRAHDRQSDQGRQEAHHDNPPPPAHVRTNVSERS